jgi:hypothetical protein
MNPNRLTRELRKLPGNIRSPHLPGGTLISAVLDRQLMAWSDRGGASRIFGDIWSEHCWGILTNGSSLFEEPPLSTSKPLVVRLDDSPDIAIQAGRHKLPNPDFLIVSPGTRGTYSVRAIDAKFAVDRLRRTQVSPESIRDLVELPGSLARRLLETQIDVSAFDELEYAPGMFIGPNSLLNDYFHQQLTSGNEPQIPATELKLIAVESREIFNRVDERELMSLLQEIDGLEATSPQSGIVLGMYYLRLASAARWFETQARQPLLTLEPARQAPADLALSTAREKIERGVSAYGLIEEWSESAEHSVARQKRVKDAARLPVRMGEIRKLVGTHRFDDEKKAVRIVRASLDKVFFRRLIESTGEIPAEPAEPFEQTIERVRIASENLRQPMFHEARTIVRQLSLEQLHDVDGEPDQAAST